MRLLLQRCALGFTKISLIFQISVGWRVWEGVHLLLLPLSLLSHTMRELGKKCRWRRLFFICCGGAEILIFMSIPFNLVCVRERKKKLAN